MNEEERTLDPEIQAEEEPVTAPAPEAVQDAVPETEAPEAPAQEEEEAQAADPEEAAESAEPVTAEPKKKLPVKKLVIVSAVAVVLIAAIVLFVVYGMPAIRYSNGVKAYDSGDYAQAVEVFSTFEGYKESDTYLAQAQLGVHYTNAGLKVQAGEYEEAIAEYKNAKDFQDAKDLLKETYVLYGDSLLSQGQYDAAVKEYRNAAENGKITEAYNQKGEALFKDKQYVQAAEAFASAGNQDRRLDCGVTLIEEEKDYTTALTILGDDASVAKHWNYANGMLSLEAADYQAAMNFFGECAGLLDADARKEESLFLLAEKCLHEGYLNKAKALYGMLPGEYAQGNVIVADRITLLNNNQKFLDLVGTWWATDTYYKVQADSTTSSYYYYWYQDGVRLGTVTVTCPYNDQDGTFTVKGTATYPSYQNFSSSASKLKTDMETFTFSVVCSSTIPYTIDSSSTTKLAFNGKQFDLQYKYVNQSANVYWHYTFTSKVKYGTRYMLSEDQI